jgi:hypothetical protein
MAAGSTYTPIATTTLGSAQASVTFNSFSGYTDLILVIAARSSYTGDINDAVRAVLNSDTGSNYSWTRLLGDGTTASSDRATSSTTMEIASLATSSSSNTSPSISISNFQNYSNTSTYKTVISRSNEARSYVYTYASLWRSTNAISNIVLSSARSVNFVAGSTFTLYGIAAA